MPDGTSAIALAHDIIHQFIGPDGVDLEGADNHLTELEIPPKQKMTIMTRLSAIALNADKEANNIARALIAADWSKGKSGDRGDDDERQTDMFPDTVEEMDLRPPDSTHEGIDYTPDEGDDDD